MVISLNEYDEGLDATLSFLWQASEEEQEVRYDKNNNNKWE